jgi:hypothetical protein
MVVEIFEICFLLQCFFFFLFSLFKREASMNIENSCFALIFLLFFFYRKLSSGEETGGTLESLYRLLGKLGFSLNHIDQTKVARIAFLKLRNKNDFAISS